MPGYFYGRVYKRNSTNTNWVPLQNATVCANVCAPCTGCDCATSGVDGSYNIAVSTGTVVSSLCSHKSTFQDNTQAVSPSVTVAEGEFYGAYDFYMVKV